LNVFVENAGHDVIDEVRGPVRLSYCWSNTKEEPLRTPLPQPLRAGERTVCTIRVRAPEERGQYSFSPRLVLEGMRWFDGASADAVEVTDEATNPDDDLNRYEDRITSQNGEDGIIRELLLRVGSPTRFVIEVGAGDGTENNSAQLIERYSFAACLLEGDPDRARRLARHHASRRDVVVIGAFVDAESIVSLLNSKIVSEEPDLLSIDIDGNDYHVWRVLAQVLSPRIVVIEYNASQGPTKQWIMPYDANHRWHGDNHFGASLGALAQLGGDLGYALVGTDSSGVNAFFVRADLMEQARFPVRKPADAYHALRIRPSTSVSGSADIRDTYTRGYYVNDCGGHADFGYDDPLSIGDARLRVTANFAEIRPGHRALDLGCGRGEIAVYLAARGWTVDAIDYSKNAIALATEHVERTQVPRDRIRLYNQDFDSFTFEKNAYDLVIAADVIEHVSVAELSKLYDSVSASLTERGLFVVHTFPNSWYYNYEWPRLRRLAQERGEAWPDEPRSHFECIMHINEQSTRTLTHQLRTSFSHVAMWVGSALDPFRTSVAGASHTALRASPDIFAIASQSSLEDVVASGAFLNRALSEIERAAIKLKLAAAPRLLDDGNWGLRITIDNDSDATLSSAGRAPVMLSYRWLDEFGKTTVSEGARTPLGKPLLPGEKLTRWMRVLAAPPKGIIVRVTLVQEGVAWFDAVGVRLDVTVS
jgi:SAM-dependent methyltransferase